MLALYFGAWDYWELRDKVTFNKFTKIISVNPGVTNLDIKADVYSAWKRWMLIENNAKMGRAIRAIGGDPTVAGKAAGDIYFLVNEWRLQVDLSKTAIAGSLFSDNFDSSVIGFDGKPVFQSFVSNLVTGVTTGATSTAPTAAQNAAEVWSNDVRTLTTDTGLSSDQDTKLRQMSVRFDLDPAKPNTYAADGSEITNAEFTLSKTDNGDGTFTITKV
jgi:hypothetical protein